MIDYKKLNKREKRKYIRKKIKQQIEKHGFESLESWKTTVDEILQQDVQTEIDAIIAEGNPLIYQVGGNEINQKLNMLDTHLKLSSKAKDNFPLDIASFQESMASLEAMERSMEIDRNLDKADESIEKMKEVLIASIENKDEFEEHAWVILRKLAEIEKDTDLFDAKTYKGLIE